jgi:hypothetical protein
MHNLVVLPCPWLSYLYIILYMCVYMLSFMMHVFGWVIRVLGVCGEKIAAEGVLFWVPWRGWARNNWSGIGDGGTLLGVSPLRWFEEYISLDFSYTHGGQELALVWNWVDQLVIGIFMHTTSPRVGLGPGWAWQVRDNSCEHDKGIRERGVWWGPDSFPFAALPVWPHRGMFTVPGQSTSGDHNETRMQDGIITAKCSSGRMGLVGRTSARCHFELGPGLHTLQSFWSILIVASSVMDNLATCSFLMFWDFNLPLVFECGEPWL